MSEPRSATTTATATGQHQFRSARTGWRGRWTRVCQICGVNGDEPLGPDELCHAIPMPGSDHPKHSQDQQHQQDTHDAAAAVIADARSQGPATTTEQQHENHENDDKRHDR